MDRQLQEMGNRIADLRKSHQMTQIDLAEYLGVTTKHISHVERGVSSLALKHYISLCELFQCSLDYLVFGRPHDSALQKIPAVLIDALNTSNEAEIQRIIRYINLYFEIKNS